MWGVAPGLQFKDTVQTFPFHTSQLRTIFSFFFKKIQRNRDSIQNRLKSRMLYESCIWIAIWMFTQQVEVFLKVHNLNVTSGGLK